ncbi:MAG: hypothetical protein HY674_17725 [Chloroflexi bacterium]|nr:hypothetical protein [Chloroflexota bacterium]
MKFLRRLHLYLGCFFAPLLVFYVATGWHQTFNVNRNKAVGEGETWISRLRSVHVDQIYPAASATSYSPALFRVLIVLMSISLIVTVGLGIFLAFKTSRQRGPIWMALGLGIVLPILMLWLGQNR